MLVGNHDILLSVHSAIQGNSYSVLVGNHTILLSVHSGIQGIPTVC